MEIQEALLPGLVPSLLPFSDPVRVSVGFREVVISVVSGTGAGEVAGLGEGSGAVLTRLRGLRDSLSPLNFEVAGGFEGGFEEGIDCLRGAAGDDGARGLPAASAESQCLAMKTE